jgi:hypothetical protein
LVGVAAEEAVVVAVQQREWGSVPEQLLGPEHSRPALVPDLALVLRPVLPESRRRRCCLTVGSCYIHKRIKYRPN